MNKKYLSVLVILTTVILSAFMIINSKNSNQNDDLIQVQKEDTMTKKETAIEENEYSNLTEILNFIEKKEEEFSKETLKEESKVNDEGAEEMEVPMKANNELIEELDEQVVDNDKEIEVFKVDKTTILEKLSFDEKLFILNLTKELSMNDYATIVKSIKNKGELECVREVNRILESRLNDKSYEGVKKVVEPYINMEVLE